MVNNDTENVVDNYIEKRKLSKEIETDVKALETIILADENLRKDERLKISEGRKTYVITEKGYEILKMLGYPIEINETRKLDFKEIDLTAKNIILNDNSLYELKTSKESIRIKEGD